MTHFLIKKGLQGFRYLSIVLLLTSLLMIVLEFGLRWFYQDTATGLKPEDQAYQFHPNYLISLKSNMRKRFIRSNQIGDTIYWRSNQAGFRGMELVDKPASRVMVYGDSNIQSRFTHLQDTYPEKLKQYLQTALMQEVEVINAGIIGFGPDQSLLKMTDEVALYRPDIVVLHVFADNDFGDIVRNRLVEADSAGVLISTPFPKEVDPDLYQQGVQSFMLVKLAKRAAKSLLRELPAAEADIFIERVRARCQDENQIYEQGLPKKYSHFHDHYDLDLALEPDSPAAQTKVRLMAGVLKAAQGLAQKQGFRLLVLIQPSSIDLTENNLISYLDLKKFPEYQPTRLSASVETICQEAHIPFINLYPIFLANEPHTLFHIRDDHWNERGQDLAAKETAHLLTRDGWFSAP